MTLNDRKVKILQAIINDYIQTAEPVGSRTIAKKYDMGISSATIRNEMSDLEEMGFIIQPHASSGRIPSDLGYRLYVDKLMRHRELTDDEKSMFSQVIINNVDKIDYLMKETARIISNMTHYTTIISEPVSAKTKVKQIRLFPLDDDSIMLIVVTDENMVRNNIMKIQNAPGEDTLITITKILNKTFSGCTLEDINSRLLKNACLELGEYGYILQPVTDLIVDALNTEHDMNIHLSGTKNILEFSEFDIEKVKNIFQTLEEKNSLISLLSNAGYENIKIIIGNENSIEQLRELSFITKTYKLGENAFGSIGILGPTRMDYQQVVSVLTGMVKNIEAVIKLISGG